MILTKDVNVIGKFTCVLALVYPHCLHTNGEPKSRNPISTTYYKISKGAIAPARAKKIITVIVIQPYIKHFTRKCYWIVYFFAASYTTSAKNVSISPLFKRR